MTDYRTSTCRFIKEYANFKKSYFANELTWATNEYQKDAFLSAITRIDDIVKSAHRGLITVDEAMRELASIG